MKFRKRVKLCIFAVLIGTCLIYSTNA